MSVTVRKLYLYKRNFKIKNVWDSCNVGYHKGEDAVSLKEMEISEKEYITWESDSTANCFNGTRGT